jgi:DNA-directed RNA polymerase specialized sigma24 family protein
MSERLTQFVQTRVPPEDRGEAWLSLRRADAAFDPGKHPCYEGFVGMCWKRKRIDRARCNKNRNAALQLDEKAANLEAKPEVERACDEAFAVLQAEASRSDLSLLMLAARFTYSEMAAALSMPIGTVKSSVFNARRRCAELLERRHVTPSSSRRTA